MGHRHLVSTIVYIKMGVALPFTLSWMIKNDRQVWTLDQRDQLINLAGPTRPPVSMR